MDFHQTWYKGAPPRVDELIRFWTRSAQCQGSKVNEFGLNMLFFTSLTRKRGALLLEIIIVLDRNETASNAAESAAFIP